MIKESIQYVHDRTAEYRDAMETLRVPAEVDIPGKENVTHLWIGGELKEFPFDLPARSHSCLTHESLGEWCGDAGTTIWCNFERIVAILDDPKYRENTVEMKLELTSQYIAATKGGLDMNQPQFIRWAIDNLRHELEAAMPGFVNLLRNIKFSSGQQGHGNVENGKESFGTSIEAQVAGTDKFPDELTITVPVWAELDISVSIDMAFIVDPHTQKLTLKPFTTSLQQARVVALGKLWELLEQYKGDGKLFCGSPD